MMLDDIVGASRASIDHNDLELVYRMVVPEKPKVIVEVGIHVGGSAETWINFFKPDIYIGVELCRKPDNAIPVEGINYHYLWESNSKLPETLDKVKKLLNGREIDFLFLDGGHHYDDVLSDWKMYKPLVKENGIIAFHDILYLEAECCVKRLWDDLKRNYYYTEMVTGTGSTGFGLIYKTKREGVLAPCPEQF